MNSNFYITVVDDGQKESRGPHTTVEGKEAQIIEIEEKQDKKKETNAVLGEEVGITKALWIANIILTLLPTRYVTLAMSPVASYSYSLGPQGN